MRRAFYGEMFNPGAKQDGRHGYYIMQHGDAMICGVMQMDENWEGIPPHWMGYFTVDDTDAAIERAVAAGGKVMVLAFDMPYGAHGRHRRPHGATFSIVKPPAA